MTPGGHSNIADAKNNASLAWYVCNWKCATDFGVIAEESGVFLGAVWARLREGPLQSSKVATEVEPEVAIAVLPEHQNRGLGLLLMQALIEQARPKVTALVLSVREENPAVRLYERLGFVIERRIVNRVGGMSFAMRLVLSFL
jgi:ribosomal protein S18 acetylase RimI-like enzyme